ncbi:DNA ligase D [Niastella yeongjuensis]|uniref:DNA ligase (ATP) n=1 Tax=Niastella yeongjuensis TaxID=354355 RepID=A0A1V9F2G1_9BACT|nr:DNA ligase D [Niastella yeongjuensis]OQP52540.1 DNA ligase D [Niastella yeongjuensis]SEP34650.1 bifunctional non-homologous end joining protein LigD [Niastella yeongjuensis]
MSLATYKKKRSFNQTPEPAGKKSAGKKKAVARQLHFVVQKHDATRLHYDFRLEMDGVLKSWAIPKGPSMNPADKRLAMMVEDHPYDYKDFEGIIPEGNYGAGTVIVWDEGTYEPIEFHDDPQKAEKHLLEQLRKGSLKIILHGQKLKGEFALVQIKSSEDNAWLLIKHNDKYASQTDVTKKAKSVQSGMKLEQVAKESNHEWVSNKKATSTKKSSAAKKSPRKTAAAKSQPVKKKLPQAIEALIKKSKRQAMPSGIIPMLATLTDDSFDDNNWIFEIKYDGYRALSYVDEGDVTVMSRKDLSFNKKFPPVVDALKELRLEAVLDGEIVALNEDGRSDFQLLQQWQKNGEGELVYYVFDVLWLNGYNLMHLPLVERKTILQQILPEHPMLRYSDHIENKGIPFFKAAIKQGLEGIMAKERDSAYTPKIRTRQWLKIKSVQRQEVVIAGFTETRGSRSHFGALVLGVYENDKLIYVGHTGSGFNEKSLEAIYKKLKPLVIDKPAFATKPKTNMPCTWVKPVLVGEVKFSEWTKDNILRQPIFMGLREDKNAKEVHKENAVHIDTKSTKKQTSQKMPTKTTQKKTGSTPAKKAAAPKGTTELLHDSAKEQVVTIDKKELTFTNLDKIYWPADKYTKRDLINYYDQMAPFILPYLKDRPQSMNRHPNGINKPGFYQKDVSGGKVADWLVKHDYLSESDGETKQYLVCTDEASLLYMANLGCIEMNPWHSTTKKPENPSWCVIDLDPGNISFDKVIEAAQVIKQLTDGLNIDTYCKTSGSTGLHIYIPLGAVYDYDQSRQLAELIVTMAYNEMPSFTSLERSPAKRKNKIYLDYLQNRTIQTIAAPYSLRPRPGATASAPLHWEEVKKGLSMQDFTIENMYSRAKEVGDIFKPVLGKGINLKKVLSKINSMGSE